MTDTTVRISRVWLFTDNKKNRGDCLDCGVCMLVKKQGHCTPYSVTEVCSEHTMAPNIGVSSIDEMSLTIQSCVCVGSTAHVMSIAKCAAL